MAVVALVVVVVAVCVVVVVAVVVAVCGAAGPPTAVGAACSVSVPSLPQAARRAATAAGFFFAWLPLPAHGGLPHPLGAPGVLSV